MPDESSFFRQIFDTCRALKPSPDPKLTVFILKHDSSEADKRAKIERTAETIAEMKGSRDNYDEHLAMLPHVRLGLYEERPFRFIVLTDKVAYVQDYLKAPPEPWNGGCYGDLKRLERYPVGTVGYEFARGEILAVENDSSLQWL